MSKLRRSLIAILWTLPIFDLHAACEDGFTPPSDRRDKPEKTRKVISLEDLLSEWPGIQDNSKPKANKKKSKKGQSKPNSGSKPKPKPKTSENERNYKEEQRRKITQHIADIQELLTTDGQEKAIVSELLATEWLYLQRSRQTVALVIGNAFETPGNDSKVRNLVSTLVSEGKRIIFDADSNFGPLIADVAGDRAVGISAHSQEALPLSLGKSQILSITNPYVRMILFKQSAEAVIVDPSSVTGAGLMIEKLASHVIDFENVWNLEEGGWDVSYLSSRKVGIYSTVSTLLKSLQHQGTFSANSPKRFFKDESTSEKGPTAPAKPELANPFPTFNLEIFLHEIASTDLGVIVGTYNLGQITRTATVLINGQKMQEINADSEELIPGGAVIFGSGSGIGAYEGLVFETARNLGSLGVPVATGGAGGFMETANRGAFAAGGHSIGIPMSGLLLTNERKVMSKLHTLTVPSIDYSSRIPLLLHRRKVIVIAPGSSGTLKELATTLVKMSGQLVPGQHVVFLSKQYYGDLYRWLLGLKLPPEVKDRIHIIDDSDDIVTLVEQIKSKLGDDLSELMTPQPPQPREVEQKPEPEVKEPKRYFDDEGLDEDEWHGWLD